MRNTFNIAFYCRSSRVNKRGLAPIEMSVTINGERAFINLPMKAKPEKFEEQVTSRRSNEVRNYLYTVENKINSLQASMAASEQILTLDLVRKYVRAGFQISYTLEELWADYYSVLQKKGTTLRNERKYILTMQCFYEHILPPETQVADIRHRHILDFETYLNHQYAGPTVASMLSKMKSVLLYAINHDKLQENPFNGIRINKKLKDVEFLTLAEIDAIRNKQMPNERLDRVKDLFLFQCFTALSYCDMAALTLKDYQRNEMGQTYIRKCRAKTQIEFCTVLFEDAEAIAQKYGYQLPVISNQRYNGYLKEIGDLCQIDKVLHSHIGRHTAACYLLNRGLPIEVVSRILGHTNTRMTRHYAKLLDDTVFREIKRLEQIQ